MSKLFIVVVCALAVKQIEGDVAVRIKAIMAPVHDKCVEENGVEDSYFERARNGDFSTDEKFKCYLKCVFDGFEMIKADQTFDIETGLKVIPGDLRHLYEETSYKCGTVLGSDLCDSAYKTAVCNYENNKDNFYFL